MYYANKIVIVIKGAINPAFLHALSILIKIAGMQIPLPNLSSAFSHFTVTTHHRVVLVFTVLRLFKCSENISPVSKMPCQASFY